MEKAPGESSPQEFRHTELLSDTCIRLIQIHAELLDGEISCSLQHYETNTQTCPDYTALSYVWGDSTPTQTIYINGFVHRVHQSLWEFLVHAHSKEEMEHTWYWTDLLCIDQAHHSERNEQIARMGDIYAQAAYVTSWLGNRDETAEALKVFVNMSEVINTASEPKYAWRSPESERIHSACDQLAFKEPYWGRVWVVQEVACAKNCIVACGDLSLDFEDLLHRMEIAMGRTVRFDIISDRDRRMKRLNALSNLKSSVQRKERIRILKLMEMTSFCQATRQQDKIYGLLGLASRLHSGFDPKALEITQHKTLADVWWDIIFLILQNESDSTIVEHDMDIVASLIDGSLLPPPRMPPALEMGSSSRRADANIMSACLVSKAAYSISTQRFLGVNDDRRTFGLLNGIKLDWNIAAQHFYTKQRQVPHLQLSLGWAIHAGLRFTTWHNSMEEAPEDPTEYLPSGWFCAAHSPDASSEEIKKKHLITSTGLPPRSVSKTVYCSAAENDEGRCDLSLVVLKIKPLGITCLVQLSSQLKGKIEIYCDCCPPSTEPPSTWYPSQPRSQGSSVDDMKEAYVLPFEFLMEWIDKQRAAAGL